MADRRPAVAVIQARMGSSRLPGKVLRELAGRAVLDWTVRAAREIPGVDQVVVATSTQDADQAIEQWCDNHGIGCIRGPENDVLRRYQMAAEATSARVVIRLTADCPLLDPQVCGAVLALFHRTRADFATSADPPTWPDGLSCEILDAAALATADREAQRPSEREHVCPFITHRRHRFTLRSLVCPVPGLEHERWTLDTEADFAFLSALMARLPDRGRPASYLEVLQQLDAAPELRRLNAGLQRNTGAAQSREQEGAKAVPFSFAVATAMAQDRTSGAQIRDIDIGVAPGDSPAGPVAAGHVVLTHGRLGRVWDVDGNRYVDLVGGRPPVILGHADPEVEQRCRAQLADGDSPAFAGGPVQRVAARLSALFGAGPVRFFASAPAALRWSTRTAARQTGRRRLLVCGLPATLFAGLDLDVETISVEDPQPLHGLAGGPPVLAVMAQLVSDLSTARRGWSELRQLADRCAAPLILDESETAFRMAAGGLQQALGVSADLTVVGGPLGNGRAIAALIGAADAPGAADVVLPQVAASAVVAAEAVLDRFADDAPCDQLAAMGGQLRDELEQVLESHELADVLGFDGFSAALRRRIRLAERQLADRVELCLRAELRLNGILDDGVLRLCLAHDPFDLRQVVAAYDQAAAAVGRELSTRDRMAAH